MDNTNTASVIQKEHLTDEICANYISAVWNSEPHVGPSTIRGNQSSIFHAAFINYALPDACAKTACSLAMSNLDTYKTCLSPFLIPDAVQHSNSSLTTPGLTYPQPHHDQPPPRSIDLTMTTLQAQQSAASALSMTIPEYNNFMQTSWKVDDIEEKDEDYLVEKASKAMFGAIMHYYKKNP